MRGLVVSAIALAWATPSAAQDLPAPTPAPAQAPVPAPVPPPPLSPAPPEPCAPTASPPAPSDTGLSLGLRVAYAFPSGSIVKRESLSTNLTGMVPIWLDAGYRLSRHFYLGAYFQLAPAFVASEICPKNLSCSAYDIRAGANLHWHIKWAFANGAWAGPLDPWLGIGTGYEGAYIHLETQYGARSQQSYKAFEYANLQLGLDYAPGPLHIGGFFATSLAQFLTVTQTNPVGTDSFAIPDPALHLWFILGLRGQYDL